MDDKVYLWIFVFFVAFVDPVLVEYHICLTCLYFCNFPSLPVPWVVTLRFTACLLYRSPHFFENPDCILLGSYSSSFHASSKFIGNMGCNHNATVWVRGVICTNKIVFLTYFYLIFLFFIQVSFPPPTPFPSPPPTSFHPTPHPLLSGYKAFIGESTKYGVSKTILKRL